MNIIHHKIEQLPIISLQPHPLNRYGEGLDLEKIQQLKELISVHGFYDSKALTVCPENGHYQIIEGEHRWKAAQEAGLTEIPCVIEQLSEEDKLVRMVTGNAQSGNHPLTIGRLAVEWGVEKSSKQGKHAKAYGESIGIKDETIRNYIKAAIVYVYITEHKQTQTGLGLLKEVAKLIEIHKLPQSDWLWLHDFILEHECSKQQVIEIVKAVKEFQKELAEHVYKDETRDLIDFDEQQLAKDLQEGNERRGGVDSTDYRKYPDGESSVGNWTERASGRAKG